MTNATKDKQMIDKMVKNVADVLKTQMVVMQEKGYDPPTIINFCLIGLSHGIAQIINTHKEHFKGVYFDEVRDTIIEDVINHVKGMVSS
jgi:uncharacterized protein (UPF0297 family)